MDDNFESNRVASGLAPFCGVRQSLIEEARNRDLKWNKRHLRWFIADRIPGIPVETMTAIYAAAWGSWQAVCGLTFEQVFDASSHDLTHLTRPIDGRGGTLAEAELPPGDDRRLRLWADVGDKWHADIALAPPTQQGLIDLLAVMSHEGGHSIGISHTPRVTGKSLMDAFYSEQVRKPQDWDIAEAQRRYGQPIEQPKPPVIPVPGNWPEKFEGVCELFGGMYTVRFEKAL